MKITPYKYQGNYHRFDVDVKDNKKAEICNFIGKLKIEWLNKIRNEI